MNMEDLKQYAYLMRLHKPIGIFLLLWPTLWALWLASAGKPHGIVLAIFVAGVVLVRSAGCVMNDIADRHFDGHVARTRDRPLVTGKVSVLDALALFCILMLTAFLLVFLLNPLTIGLAMTGALMVMLYPFLKRVTHLPQLGLGVAFSWGVPMAFAAETNTIPWTAWLLFLTTALWPLIYDTLYAMADRDDDIKIGIKSSAILFGNADKILIGVLQIVFLLWMGWVGFLFKLTLSYYASLLMAAVLFVYQQVLIRARDPERCFRAFLNNNWVGLVIFVGIVLSYQV